MSYNAIWAETKIVETLEIFLFKKKKKSVMET